MFVNLFNLRGLNLLAASLKHMLAVNTCCKYGEPSLFISVLLAYFQSALVPNPLIQLVFECLADQPSFYFN